MNDQVSLAKIPKPLHGLVYMAAEAGWLARNTAGGAVLLTSPVNPQQKITVGDQMRDSVLRSSLRKIRKWGDPLKVALIEDLVQQNHGTIPLEEWQKVLGKDGPAFTGIVPVAPEPEPVGPRKHHEREPEPETPAPSLVSSSPWLAKGGDGTRYYESETVVEQHWSDGSVNYRCAKQGCDYAAPLPNPVARHFSNSRDHQTSGVRPPRMQGEPYVEQHRSPEARAKRLAQELIAALAEVDVNRNDTEGLAQAMAQRIVAMRDAQKRTEEEARGEMTPEQILERIRQMVDQGEYLKRIREVRERDEQIARMEQELQQAREQSGEVEERWLETEHRLNKLQGEWDALVEMVSQRRDAG